MSWRQVVDAVRAPKKYRPLERRTRSLSPEGMEFEMVQPGAYEGYDEKTLARRIENGKLPDGFTFEYHFSPADALLVRFDGAGAVVNVADMFTLADLFYPERRADEYPPLAPGEPQDPPSDDEPQEEVSDDR